MAEIAFGDRLRTHQGEAKEPRRASFRPKLLVLTELRCGTSAFPLAGKVAASFREPTDEGKTA
jgi:hypothetical protein